MTPTISGCACSIEIQNASTVWPERLRPLRSMAVNEIQKWEFAEHRPEDDNVAAASYETTSVYGYGHPLYYDNVLSALRQSLYDAGDAVRL